jgi:hypothetical protein
MFFQAVNSIVFISEIDLSNVSSRIEVGTAPTQHRVDRSGIPAGTRNLETTTNGSQLPRVRQTDCRPQDAHPPNKPEVRAGVER